ncbi:MAG: DTW domain-containing protein [Epsilonproteobacteria bacterium]|nr:DTW domain-containing protein [Campylobacterota bacterium]
MRETLQTPRNMCYNCNRPTSSCLCRYITPLQTKTKFIILMHPKEYKRIKNNTGRLTKLSLCHAELFVGVDFSQHQKVNALIQNPNNFCTILYPGEKSINLNTKKLSLQNRQLIIFIIDATWDSAKPILRLSTNLHPLSRISFTHTQNSMYQFKRQPFVEALSTMESTYAILKALQTQKIETIEKRNLDNFIKPFEKMVHFQMQFAKNPSLTL